MSDFANILEALFSAIAYAEEGVCIPAEWMPALPKVGGAA